LAIIGGSQIGFLEAPLRPAAAASPLLRSLGRQGNVPHVAMAAPREFWLLTATNPAPSLTLFGPSAPCSIPFRRTSHLSDQRSRLRAGLRPPLKPDVRFPVSGFHKGHAVWPRDSESATKCKVSKSIISEKWRPILIKHRNPRPATKYRVKMPVLKILKGKNRFHFRLLGHVKKKMRKKQRTRGKKQRTRRTWRTIKTLRFYHLRR